MITDDELKAVSEKCLTVWKDSWTYDHSVAVLRVMAERDEATRQRRIAEDALAAAKTDLIVRTNEYLDDERGCARMEYERDEARALLIEEQQGRAAHVEAQMAALRAERDGLLSAVMEEREACAKLCDDQAAMWKHYADEVPASDFRFDRSSVAASNASRGLAVIIRDRAAPIPTAPTPAPLPSTASEVTPPAATEGARELDPLDLDTLDPGIRDVVKMLRDAGFQTMDSGDGSKAKHMACALAFPMVAIEGTKENLAAEVDCIAAMLASDDRKWNVEASYNPEDPTVVIIATSGSDDVVEPCSFCFKPIASVQKMFGGDRGACICGDCVAMFWEIARPDDETAAPAATEGAREVEAPTPNDGVLRPAYREMCSRTNCGGTYDVVDKVDDCGWTERCGRCHHGRTVSRTSAPPHARDQTPHAELKAAAEALIVIAHGLAIRAAVDEACEMADFAGWKVVNEGEATFLSVIRAIIREISALNARAPTTGGEP